MLTDGPVQCHRFVSGQVTTCIRWWRASAILGGVHVEYERGLAGHSDADVLFHAIADALLGAAALGDIGRHFPDGGALRERRLGGADHAGGRSGRRGGVAAGQRGRDGDLRAAEARPAHGRMRANIAAPGPRRIAVAR